MEEIKKKRKSFSEKTRKKMSLIRKGKTYEKLVGIKKARLWKKSKSLEKKKSWQDPEMREKIIKNMRGKHLTEETKKNMSLAKKGKKRKLFSKKWKKNMSLGKKKSWQDPKYRKKMKIRDKKVSQNLKINNPMFNSKSRKKMRKTLKKLWAKPNSTYNSSEYRKIRSLVISGKNNPNYRNGKSKEPYPLDWNDKLKEFIRNRDKKCQICNLSRKNCNKIYNRDLIVHHINRNKKNLNPNNLICLCIYHHGKISNIQDDLRDYFQYKLLK